MTHIYRRLYIVVLLFTVVFPFSAATRYHVDKSLSDNGNGLTWATAFNDLEHALSQARAGDEIWVRGGEGMVYKPSSAAGFTLRSGVKLYGGFVGTEQSADERRHGSRYFEFACPTVLSGDLQADDHWDEVELIYPMVGDVNHRSDNATHVLTIDLSSASATGNNNGYPTVVDGFTVSRGHADSEGEYGGGIFVRGSNKAVGVYRIENCYFAYNYATKGGAVYVAPEVQGINGDICLINRCCAYNNAAGVRAAIENEGGAFYIAGAGTLVNSSVFNNENGGLRLSADALMVNCTVVRNTGGGLDLITSGTASETSVFNTVVWGNSSLYSQYRPGYSHSAFPEEDTGADGNIAITDTNNGTADGPLFTDPSNFTGFDRSYTGHAYPVWRWDLQEHSALVYKGDNDAYSASLYGDLDIAGNSRRSGGSLDIGAFERQQVSASRRRYVKEGGTGDGMSWNTAMGDPQKAIDELYEAAPGTVGEVWIAKGTYEPKSNMVSGQAHTASFRMRGGISVYGGFAGTETNKSQRPRPEGYYPWDFENETILRGAGYDGGQTVWSDVDVKWSIVSHSRHVVWFAPYEEEDFPLATVLEGVTIEGGNAQGDMHENTPAFVTDRGAGIYMNDANAYLYNCVVRNNYASATGGGIYLKDGRVFASLVYNSSAATNGGGVYVDEEGIVARSHVANCSAGLNGAGIYLYNTDNTRPEYLQLSTCVVSNNTARGNAAVYCDRGGVCVQNTIVNNLVTSATDMAGTQPSRTAGVYADEYALVVNSVLWNNDQAGNKAQMYAQNSTSSKVRFMNCGISNMNSSVWNNVLQQDLVSLGDANSGDADGITPEFVYPDVPVGGCPGTGNESFVATRGVQDDWKEIKYHWEVQDGANLRARGMTLNALPTEVLMDPELDLKGAAFQHTPSLGAQNVAQTKLRAASDIGMNALDFYVNTVCTTPGHDGSSWEKAYRSVNEALGYFKGLKNGDVVDGLAIDGETKFRVHVAAGDIYPVYAYVNADAKSATFDFPAMQGGDGTLYIYGGYAAAADGESPAGGRDPLVNRTMLNGLRNAASLSEGIYHVVTLEPGAKVAMDGFHILGGYAAGKASYQRGGGFRVLDGAVLELTDCIIENCTAVSGAAIDAPAATVSLTNCVLNNNTNTTGANPLVNARALAANYVTVVNNQAAAPEASLMTNSFAAGNTSGNTHEGLATTGAEGAKNFANPTNAPGATLSFDTWLGSYAVFRPLTGSSDNAVIINQGGSDSGMSPEKDIAGHARDLGGQPDLGAYEAILPETGEVYYVRGNDGDDGNDGLSWGKAFKTVERALDEAGTGTKIWVAAGTYTGSIHGNPNNTGDGANVHYQPYAFKMKEGVDVYGGFPAVGLPGEEDRDPITYQTILQAAEEPGNTDPEKNKTSVGRVLVQPEHFETTTIWDGFTIRNGFLNTSGRFQISGNIMKLNPNEKNLGKVCGAGVFLMGNGVLENCIVRDNKILGYEKNIIENSGGQHAAGGGVYCVGGEIRNCQILSNEVAVYTLHKDDSNAAAFAYGGGLYILNDAERELGNDVKETEVRHRAAIYNSVVADNKLFAGRVEDEVVRYHTMSIGAGVCQVSGNFYNNTIVGNIADTGESTAANIICGGLFVYNTAEIYNCIVVNNEGFYRGSELRGISNYKDEQLISFSLKGSNGNSPKNDAYEVEEDNIKIYYSNVGRKTESGFEKSDLVDYETTHNIGSDPLFADETKGKYQLQYGSECLNAGTEEILDGNGGMIVIPDYDAEYTDRIKDCAIDMGAYELDNTRNIGYETGDDTLVYYVTQNGSGLRSGGSQKDAACAMKLQAVLTHAGQTAEEHPDKQVVVKIAGYATDTPYRANTLLNPDDPQSYTFEVPYGITVMGGYDENAGDWDDNRRNATENRTILSPVAQIAGQDVNGYHAVTFGSKPDGWGGSDKTTVLDGIYLQDGKAVSATAYEGVRNDQGGGAVVPEWGHVRNCVVRGCQATRGGALYVEPGGLVSGTVMVQNTAAQGGALYTAQAAGATTETPVHSHLISLTVTDNDATGTGGGIYMEDYSAMVTNSIFWNNTASSDKNVSGLVTETMKDELYGKVIDDLFPGQDMRFYPFNNCFVETYELPGNFINSSLEGEAEERIYFVSAVGGGIGRSLQPYSPMVKHGSDIKMYNYLVEHAGLADCDLTGDVERVQEGYDAVDAGAFAYLGGMPDELFTTLFVSQTTNVEVSDGRDADYLGRSFYTSFTWLGDALKYIERQRATDKGKDAEFIILMAGGTYKPHYRRRDAVGTIIDQRQNSFVIPAGVSVYGGFTGKEKYCSEGATTIPVKEGEEPLKDLEPVDAGNIQEIARKRDFSDLNGNNIYEPWELAEQTILSGHINVSSTESNVYHVVYSEKYEEGTALDGKPVVLDGLTVMDGRTSGYLTSVQDGNEVGRGGGIYSSGVPYVLHRCRLLKNLGYRGNAIYLRGADLKMVGTILAGNATVDDCTTGSEGEPAGGALYLGTGGSLYAVNTLWVNNETAGRGGAFSTTDVTESTIVSLMNNTVVRNKAATCGAIYSRSSNSSVCNTLFWGNEAEKDEAGYDESTMKVTYSASDRMVLSGEGNIRLDAANLAAGGPRFANPSATVGVAGNSDRSQWNPASTSVLTDAGNGVIKSGEEIPGAGDAYRAWIEKNVQEYADIHIYMKKKGGGDYFRYDGPLTEKGEKGDRNIDIGLFEYQYQSNFQHMPAIYVDVVERGDGSGNSWANATSDLKGALAGVATMQSDDMTQDDNTPEVYVRGGEHVIPKPSASTAFFMNVNSTYAQSVTVKGAYTDAGLQDFSQPTVIKVAPDTQGDVKVLLNISTSDKPVTIEGFTFINTNEDGTGMEATTTDTGGSLTLRQTAFRANTTGVKLNNYGSALFVNTLFADNSGTGLSVEGKNIDEIKVVNGTFAQNGTDMTAGNMMIKVYNSVSWGNDTQNMPESDCNVVFGANVSNDDIREGPNFIAPSLEDKAARNYGIQPSMKLLNKGDNSWYVESYPTVDFVNGKRIVDDKIDIGAYEYQAPLKQIIYVKSDVVGSDGSGSGWDNPIDGNGLQGAVDLAGIYADNHEDEKGYVFVHRNVDCGKLVFRLGNVKVYGTMNDETSTEETAKEKVNGLLAKRQGILHAASRSKVEDLTLSADGVVDGFEVEGTTHLDRGVLSTSIVKNDVNGEADGVLYNALVLGGVSGVRAVNVTATGAIGSVEGSYNNRAEAQPDNGYVTAGYWGYQLKETSTDIDPEGEQTYIEEYINNVGHRLDLIGNNRIRGTVDNGCFETWNINVGLDEEEKRITLLDKPLGLSVVYVREGSELLIEKGVYSTEDTPFSPGFLLLEHQAGLRGLGNYVRLGDDRFAVERKVEDGGGVLTYLPFKVSHTEGMEGLAASRYDGAVRASYSYKYEAEDSKAWVPVTAEDGYGLCGLWLENANDAEAKVRFYGASYTEGGADKAVALAKYNYNDSWSTPTNGGNKFTHKENMSWNLFGSPYLCAMNYADMEYGRVMYGMGADGSYKTIGTLEEDDRQEGHIPACDGIFTQTATLKEQETFNVGYGEAKSGEAYADMKTLAVALSRECRAGGEADVLHLRAVPSDLAREDFDVNADGVKWMGGTGMPRLYALRGGGRYSLLSAVDEDGAVAMGLRLPAAGAYTFSLPDGCDTEGYSAVVLHDAQTGRSVDLLKGDYGFQADEVGDVEGRFTLSFHAVADDEVYDGLKVRVFTLGRGQIVVTGLQEGDVVRVFTSAGVQQDGGISSGALFRLQLPRGLYVFQVVRNASTVSLKAVVE